MPNIKSAKKKAKQDVKRTIRNEKHNGALDRIFKSIKKTTKAKAASAIGKAYSVIDKAAKKKVIHKNKAARLKSRVSRLAHGK